MGGWTGGGGRAGQDKASQRRLTWSLESEQIVIQMSVSLPNERQSHRVAQVAEPMIEWPRVLRSEVGGWVGGGRCWQLGAFTEHGKVQSYAIAVGIEDRGYCMEGAFQNVHPKLPLSP